MNERPTFEEEPFERDFKGNITRETFVEFVRNSHDHMLEIERYIKRYDLTFDEYMAQWDGNLESLDDNIVDLLHDWIDDGTFAEVINEDIFKTKADQEDLENVTAHLAQKATKGEIGLADLNKNKTKFDETWMTDEFKQQMAGDTPVSTTIAPRSLTTSKYSDKSILPQQTNFIELSNNLYDNTKNTLNTIILSDGTISESSGYHLSDYILVSPDTKYFCKGAPSLSQFGENGNFIGRTEVAASGDTFITNPKTHFVRLNMQHTSAYYPEGRLNLGEDKGYEPYRAILKGVKADEHTLEDNSVSEQKIKDNAITSTKRTSLGELPLITYGYASSVMNVDTINRKLVFDGTTFVFHRGKRYTLPSGTEVDYGINLVAGVVIYFDTASNSLYTKDQTDLRGVTETSIMFAVIYSHNDTWKLVVNAEYTVDGKPKHMPYTEELATDKDKPYMFSVEKIMGDYPNEDLKGIGDEGSPFNYTDDDHVLVYGLYDELVSNNPEYVTKNLLGETDGIPIYEYVFSPPRSGDRTIKPFPKVLLGGAVHGGEGLGVAALYYFLKRVCEDWGSSDVLEYLRHNVIFVVCPIRSPRDYNNKTYVNVNGVNINRNFDYMWESSSDPTKGPEPFSEIETVVQRDWMLANDDAIHHLDIHIRGGRQMVADNRTMWLAYDNNSRYQFLQNTIEQVSRRWSKKYPELPSGILYGHVTGGGGSPGVLRSYSERVVGIPSSLWEGFSRSTTMSEMESKNVVDMNVEYLGQTVTNIIKHYQG